MQDDIAEMAQDLPEHRAAEDSLPPLCVVDVPSYLNTGDVPITLQGWALAADGVSDVLIAVDGESAGAAEIGLGRPDVGKEQSAYPNADLAGFRATGLTFDDADATTIEVSMLVISNSGNKYSFYRRLPVISNRIAQLTLAGNLCVEAVLTEAEPAEAQDAIRQLLAANLIEDAETLSSEFVRRVQHIGEAFALHAEIASRAAEVGRGTWENALDRWRYTRERFPGRLDVNLSEAQVLLALGRAQEARVLIDDLIRISRGAMGPAADLMKELASPSVQAGKIPRRHADDGGVKLSDQDLMLEFESIGSNCDFGFLQRSCGAEPLGLLRFAGVPYGRLIEALDTGFDGVGDPKNTSFKIIQSPDPRPDYWVGDPRLGLQMHTFIYPETLTDAAEFSRVFEAQCTRLRYLSRRLIAQLRNGDKILLYHSLDMLSEVQIRSLFKRITAYGPSPLVVVQPSTKNHPSGSIEVIERGLIVAQTHRFVMRLGYGAEMDRDGWLRICRTSFAQVQQWRQAPSVTRV